MARRRVIANLAALLTADGTQLRREFASVDRQITRSTRGWQRSLRGGLKLGFGVVGASGALNLLQGEIRHVINDIESIPGIPPETVASVQALRADFAEARAGVDQFVAAGVTGFAQFAQGIGYAAAAWEAAFKERGLLGILKNPVAAFSAGLDRVAEAAPAGPVPVNARGEAQKRAARDRAEEERERDRLREQRELLAEADRVFRGTRTAAELFNMELRDLDGLFQRGLIDAETYFRAQAKAMEELEQAQDKLTPEPVASAVGRAPGAPLSGSFQSIGGLLGARATTGLVDETVRQTVLLRDIKDLLKSARSPQAGAGLPIF